MAMDVKVNLVHTSGGGAGEGEGRDWPSGDERAHALGLGPHSLAESRRARLLAESDAQRLENRIRCGWGRMSGFQHAPWRRAWRTCPAAIACVCRCVPGVPWHVRMRSCNGAGGLSPACYLPCALQAAAAGGREGGAPDPGDAQAHRGCAPAAPAARGGGGRKAGARGGGGRGGGAAAAEEPRAEAAAPAGQVRCVYAACAVHPICLLTVPCK